MRLVPSVRDVSDGVANDVADTVLLVKSVGSTCSVVEDGSVTPVPEVLGAVALLVTGVVLRLVLHNKSAPATQKEVCESDSIPLEEDRCKQLTH